MKVIIATALSAQVALTANYSSANGPVFPGVTKDCSGGTGVSPVAVFDARCYFRSL